MEEGTKDLEVEVSTTKETLATEMIKRKKAELRCEVLQKQMNFLHEELKELKRKINSERKEVATQTETENGKEENFETIRDNSSIGSFASKDGGGSLADALRETVEDAIHSSGYVLDESTGMYYDYNSGYYYDANSHLFYDPKTGTYFYYNSETNEYKFHSQVEIPATVERKKNSRKKKTKKNGNFNFPGSTENSDEHERNLQSKSEYQRLKETGRRKHRDKNREQNVHLRKCNNGKEPSMGSSGLGSKNEEEEIDRESDKEDDISDKLNCKEPSNQNKDHGSSEKDGGKEDYELEEGEITDSSESSLETGEDDEMDTDCEMIEEESVSLLDYPPCLRMIITESSVLPMGSLHVITCMGGTVGREGTSHVLKIPEASVSKVHAEVSYNYDQKQYLLKDLGSQNGSRINGILLSEARTVSTDHCISHDDVLSFGSSSMRVHIHPGSETCNGCEPGVVQAVLANHDKVKVQTTSAQESKEELRRKQLKMLKKKYNLEKMNYIQDDPSNHGDGKYKDRAEERRRTKGSDNPHIADDAPSSVERAIIESNKGHQMLLKMGWKNGESLGKNGSGIREPISVFMHSTNAGLGSILPWSIDRANTTKKTSFTWKKAQERFKQLDVHKSDTAEKTNDIIDIFSDSDVPKSTLKKKTYTPQMSWIKGRKENLNEQLQVTGEGIDKIDVAGEGIDTDVT